MSAKPVVWITRQLSQATLQRARCDYEVILDEQDVPSDSDAIVAMSARVDAIVPCHSEVFDAATVARLDDRLKIVANHSVGLDHCDLDALGLRGIAVTNTPGVLNDATAEIAMLLMLGAARRASEGDRLVRSGKWSSWSPAFMVGKQVSGARLGILGMGGVGQVVARRARGFDMTVHYHNRTRLPPELEQGAIFHDSIDSLLFVSDFLSLNAPATPQTRHVLDAASIGWLPKGAVVVNTARGALVDEDALHDALSSGRIAAAGLDCFEQEPGGNPQLAALDNVFLLPHIGSATVATRDAMGYCALDNLDAYFAGEALPNRVA